MQRGLGFLADDLGLGALFVAAVDDGDDGLGEIDEGQTGGGVAAKGCGGACVAVVADALYERNLRQQGNVHLFSQLLAAFLAEDVVLVFGQFGGGEPCHILDETEDGHIDLLIAVHIDAFAGIGQSYLLRGGHDDGSRDGQRLE